MKTRIFKCKNCGIEKELPWYRKDKFCSRECAGTFNQLPRELTIRNQKIIEFFKKIKSYTKAAAVFHLSKQRIDQIIRKYIPEFVKTKSKVGVRYFNYYYGLPCKHCGKKLNIEVRHKGKQYCENCESWLNNPNFVPKPIYKNCSSCGKSFDKLHRKAKGLCNSCYSYYKYHADPGYRQSVLESSTRWQREKKATDPIWKEKLDKYHREYSLKKKRGKQGT